MRHSIGSGSLFLAVMFSQLRQTSLAGIRWQPRHSWTIPTVYSMARFICG
jgi:hypothetical protein